MTDRQTSPEGWYDDPNARFDKRWWDGAAWTARVSAGGSVGMSPVNATDEDATQVLEGLRSAAAASPPPAAPPPAPPAPPSATATAPPTQLVDAKTRDWPMWGLVAMPLVGFAVTLVLGGSGAALVAVFIITLGGNIALVVTDLKTNPEIGTKTSEGIAVVLLLAPLYPFNRQRSLGRPPWPAAAHLATIALFFVLVSATGAGNIIETRLLEPEIERWAAGTLGFDVQVECPDNQPADPGHRFVCTMSDGIESVGVRVEVLNRDGDVEWQIVG